VTALAANRLNMPGVKPTPNVLGLVAAAVHIYKGALIACVNGYWEPADVAPDLELAIAMQEVDNTLGGAGDKTIQVEFVKTKRLVLLKNDSGAPITQAQIGGDGWIIDDQTVSATGAIGTHTRVVPWEFYEANRQYSTTQVWVEVL